MLCGMVIFDTSQALQCNGCSMLSGSAGRELIEQCLLALQAESWQYQWMWLEPPLLLGLSKYSEKASLDSRHLLNRLRGYSYNHEKL